MSQEYPRIIAFCGTKGSGKTTAAHRLRRFLSPSSALIQFCEIVNFAHPLKQISLATGFTYEELYGLQKETPSPSLGITAREFLQDLGDFFRIHLPQHYPNWLQGSGEKFTTYMMRERIKSSKAQWVLVDDVRYPDEYQMLQEFGAKVCYIERSGGDKKFSDHSSEQKVKEFSDDLERIENNGTLDEFFGKVDKILLNMMGSFPTRSGEGCF